MRPSKAPDDARYGPNSYYPGMWHLPQISASTAWDTTTGSKQVGSSALHAQEPQPLRRLSAAPAPSQVPTRRNQNKFALLLSASCLQVGVCVIDTGARPTHQDLAGNIAGGWNRCVQAAALTL